MRFVLAPVDNLLEDLEEKRYAIAVKLPGSRCSTSRFAARARKRSRRVRLPRAWRSPSAWSPIGRGRTSRSGSPSAARWLSSAAATRHKTADGWVVDFGALEFGVRKRGKDFEISRIVDPYAPGRGVGDQLPER